VGQQEFYVGQRRNEKYCREFHVRDPQASRIWGRVVQAVDSPRSRQGGLKREEITGERGGWS
jgi:hypothetical protein